MLTTKKTTGTDRDRAEVIERLTEFLPLLNAKVQKAHTDAGFTNIKCDALSVESGQKNAKIVRTNVLDNGQTGDQRSVYGFVNLDTGDIYKAAGWKAPAKGVRGNIFDADHGLHCCGQYGVAYLR